MTLDEINLLKDEAYRLSMVALEAKREAERAYEVFYQAALQFYKPSAQNDVEPESC